MPTINVKNIVSVQFLSDTNITMPSATNPEGAGVHLALAGVPTGVSQFFEGEGYIMTIDTTELVSCMMYNPKKTGDTLQNFTPDTTRSPV